MKHVNRRQIYFGIFWVILITSFLFCAALLISVANGYHLNRNNLRLEKTGMIVVSGSTEPVDITVNGITKTVALPAKFSLLFPGSYNVIVQKDGYFPFQKTFQLAGGKAVVINDIHLVLQNLSPVEGSNDTKTINKINNDNSNEITQFSVLGNEIWVNDSLVTRFSQPIISAIYDSSVNQYFVQLTDGIHVISADGTNDNLILNPGTTNPIIMSTSSNTLSYIKENKVYQIQIR